MRRPYSEAVAPGAAAPCWCIVVRAVVLQAGEVFASRFWVVRALDDGGFGEVCEALDANSNAPVALKVLHREMISHPSLRERFEQESRITSLFSSPYVTAVIDAGVDKATERPWVAFELLSGETLATRLKRESALTPKLVSALFAQLGLALGAAHQAGVVHADVKPANLFLTGSPEAPLLKVLDFGISRVLRAGRTSTKVTTLVGSPEWTAPEQFVRGARLRASTDVWPLGMIAFRALTGAHYLRNGGEDSAVMPCLREIVTGDLPPASERARELGVAARLPPAFDAWFRHCVTRVPDERFQHARAATDALQTALRPLTNCAPTVELREPPQPFQGARQETVHLSNESLPEVRTLLGRSDYSAARERLDAAVSSGNADAEAWALRGECDLRLGRYDDAVEDWSEAIALAPGVGDYLVGRSAVFEAQGKHGAARADLTLAAVMGHEGAKERLREWTKRGGR